jgi:hypothetical protein
MSDEIENPHYIPGPPRGPAYSPPPVVDLEDDAMPTPTRERREPDGAG